MCHSVVHCAHDYFYGDSYDNWGVNGDLPVTKETSFIFASIWSIVVLVCLAVISPPLGAGMPLDH
jgi:hypothetical protein